MIEHISTGYTEMLRKGCSQVLEVVAILVYELETDLFLARTTADVQLVAPVRQAEPSVTREPVIKSSAYERITLLVLGKR